MEYNFRAIEQKWQQQWKEQKSYSVSNESDKPKYYVLDMFPYPSGAGLHVGHPLGYIASDIYSRYKRLKGFNVLHPMGFDSFGLPAEQYAIETGQHPAETTKKNIATFKNQLDKIGFCYDWEREVQTSDPNYYKWTQKLFLELYNSYFCNTQQKARPIADLVAKYETKGCNKFSAEQWNNYSKAEKEEILMNRRLAFSKYGEVNWCEALGTVLANDEVVNGVSERGGHPVVKKKMRQWYLRITSYADRLLEGLERVDFSDSMKEMQRNWIGRSEGAEITFNIQHSTSNITVYTTRPDTIFGVDFMVLAPELELVNEIKSAEQTKAVDDYITYVKSRSDRERMAEVKLITGCFTGAYAINPFNGKQIPIWISEYVLAGYGTGAIMAVPCGDERDFKFATHFNIPITNIIGEHFNGKEANPTKDAILENSDFLNGLVMRDAIKVANDKIEAMGIGKRKVNFRMRDAGFSRQRYWGEPFPIVWQDGVATALTEKDLPLELPHVAKYGPGPEGEGPLANITEWVIVKPHPQPLSKGEGSEGSVTKSSSEYAGIFNLTPNPSKRERGSESSDFGYVTNTPEQWEHLLEKAKANRQNATEAETIMWDILRNRQMDDYKFRRQHPIAGFIPDFVCLEKKLIIEIDGGYHNTKEQEEYDNLRTQWLNEYKYNIIRFTNDEVINNTESVKEKILIELNLIKETEGVRHPLSFGEGAGGEVRRETSTMPGYAGSSWYFLRYMDPHNKEEFVSRKASDYWNSVDLYIGGTEHAVGHLLYSRMWTKVLYDLGYIGFDEPFKRLVNQGMITGKSFFVDGAIYSDDVIDKVIFKLQSHHSELPFPFEIKYDGINLKRKEIIGDVRLRNAHRYLDSNGRFTKSMFESYCEFEIIYNIDFDKIFVDWDSQNKTESGEPYLNGIVIEKMSKSKYNVDNPDDMVEQYGADTFRMYEMFLGPVEQSKPWDTKGIEGVHRFLRKLWRLFFDELKGKVWNEEKANAAELKIVHRAIKKIEEDTERFSFNTAVSAFMVCVNELADAKCNKKEVLEQMLILLVPYAPHIAEELWHELGNAGSILDATYPTFNPQYLVETTKEYPVSINGKMRSTMNIALDATEEEVQKLTLANEIVQKWLEGKAPKKIIFVKGKMINLVI